MNDVQHPPVQQAWNDVMQLVRGLGKHESVTAGPARFNFRGIDAVMNSVGPALREARVSVVPTSVTIAADREVPTSNNKIMRNVTVMVQYTITGPLGDTIVGASLGESSDAGDKAVTKAMSVAYRTFLLQSLTLPTDEEDPDHTQHDRVQRGAQQQPAQRPQAAQEVSSDEVDALRTMDALEALWSRAEAAGQGNDDRVKAAFQAQAAKIQGGQS